jgi:NhaP-type Na+/H+ or K+/H+ antiporter
VRVFLAQLKDAFFITWGGLRGAVGLALALVVRVRMPKVAARMHDLRIHFKQTQQHVTKQQIIYKIVVTKSSE